MTSLKMPRNTCTSRSSNSARLVDVALKAGAGDARLVDDAGDLDWSWFDGVETVGLTAEALQGFTCACVLGGTQPEPLILPARSRTALENFAQSGKRVFCEYMQSFALNYCKPAESTRFLRLKCVTTDFAGLPQGTLLRMTVE